MADKILNVPYYQQHQIDGALNSYWQNRSCSLLALKMVIDYYRAKEGREPIDLSKLFVKTVASGGTSKTGDWYQAAIVKTAQSYGFKAWRRSWQPSQRDIDFFRDEGLTKLSLEAWQSQARAEALPSLMASIKNDHPVIVSVAKEFEDIKRAHLIVLTGFKLDRSGDLAGFYYNDPYSPTTRNRKNQIVPINKFTSKWIWRGIFVEPKATK